MQHIIVLLCILCSYQVLGFQALNLKSNCRTSSQKICGTILMSSSDQSDMEGKRGMKGYYRRPSRAIEKGGGFYVPGLEGEKIRVLSAGILVLMIASNRAGVQTADASQITSEAIGVIMALILFLQGLAEAFPSGGSSTSSSIAPASFLSVIQSAPRSLQTVSVESAARSIIQTCEDVSYILIVSNIEKKVVLELGPVTGTAASAAACEMLRNFSGRNVVKNEEGVPVLSMFQAAPSFLARTTNTIAVPDKVQSIAVIVDGKNDWTWMIAAGSELSEFNKSADWISSLTAAPF